MNREPKAIDVAAFYLGKLEQNENKTKVSITTKDLAILINDVVLRATEKGEGDMQSLDTLDRRLREHRLRLNERAGRQTSLRI